MEYQICQSICISSKKIVTYMKFAGDFLLGQTFVRNDKNSLLSRGGLQFEMTWHRGTKFHQRKNYEKFTEDID